MKKLFIIITAALFIGLLPSCKKIERLVLVQTMSVNETTLLIKGELVDAGEKTLSYGFCWSTKVNPSYTDQKVILGASAIPKSFEATLTGLNPGVKYYARAFASDGAEFFYGEVFSFTVSSGSVDFIYDDGTPDNGWRFNPGYAGLLGNLFPVGASGNITAIKLYFDKAEDAGSGTLTIDVFNSGRTKIGGVGAFTPPNDNWTTRSANISFNGQFYVMAVWTEATGYVNYLGIDENGPNVSMDLAWFRNSSGQWAKLSSEGNPQGIFLIRITATIFKSNSIPVYTEMEATNCHGAGLPEGLQKRY